MPKPLALWANGFTYPSIPDDPKYFLMECLSKEQIGVIGLPFVIFNELPGFRNSANKGEKKRKSEIGCAFCDNI